METAFGNDHSYEGKLWRYLDPKGRSNTTIFYSGHGVPGLKDKRGYLLPVDANAETPEINGYSLDTLLRNLGKLKTRSVTVFIDACFSGDSQAGTLVKAASGITITPKLPDTMPNMTVITAAQGDQVASWDIDAKHGLFTKYLLDALYGDADKSDYGNGDGKVTLGEVREHLDDQMTRAARRQFGRHQNVWVKGDSEAVLVNEIPKVRLASIVTAPSPQITMPAPPKSISIERGSSVRPFIHSTGLATRWKMQSVFGSRLQLLGELGVRMSDTIRSASNDNIHIEFFEPGELSPSLRVLEAVSKGKIDAAWSTPGYHSGLDGGLLAFAGMPFTPKPRIFAAWLEQHGDKIANDLFYSRYGVHHLTCGVVGPEGAGWFKRPINNILDFRNLRMRFFGLGAKVVSKLGVSVQRIGAKDVYSALKQNTIGATEFSVPYIDKNLKFYQVAENYYYPGWHKPATAIELIVNNRAWHGLSSSQRSLIQQVCDDNVRFGLDEDERLQNETLEEYRSLGVNLLQLPWKVLEEIKRTWDAVAADEAKRSTLFAKAFLSLQKL
jgi:TRAP-type mannitol/chloroaromatic compound transport system substrate-binding protein